MAEGILSGFLTAARTSEAEILAKHPKMVDLLEKVTDALQRMTGTEALSNSQAPVASLLLLNSYSLYLSAVRIALSGQSPPLFAVLRACLESSLYAVIAAQSDENRKIWLERHEDIGRCRKTYTKEAATKYLQTVDPNLANFVTEHYGTMIEFGAHPNVRSVVHHVSFKKQEKLETMSLAILHNATSIIVLQSLMACFELGTCVLWLGVHALPDFEPAQVAFRSATSLHSEFLELARSLSDRSRPQ